MSHDTPTGPRRSRARTIAAGVACALTLAGALTAVAVAVGATGSLTLGSASSPTLTRTLVVSPSGRTLYALSPETTHHLLCKSKACLSAWPPVTVRNKNVKLKDGHGVHGTLALLHRANGAWQVTLRGKPLYRYSGDEASGDTNGEGIKSFGGTWHIVSAGTTPAPAPPTSPPSGPYPPY